MYIFRVLGKSTPERFARNALTLRWKSSLMERSQDMRTAESLSKPAKA